MTYREDFRGSAPNFVKLVFNKFITNPKNKIKQNKGDNEITSLLIVKQNFRLYVVLFDLCFQRSPGVRRMVLPPLIFIVGSVH